MKARLWPQSFETHRVFAMLLEECAEHDRQLGGESLLSSLMVAKD
jgi:hypothetical protein